MPKKKGPKPQGYQQLTISLPPEDVAEIDAMADYEMHGMRSIVIRSLVRIGLDAHARRQARRKRRAA